MHIIFRGIPQLKQVCLAILVIAVSAPLSAQITLSTIRGSVHDPSGAPVAGAKVSVTGTGTGLSRSSASGATGDFEIPDLPRGTYRLIVVAAGFTDFLADNIILETNQVRRIDAALELGAIGTQITVKANAAVIETDTAKIQAMVGSKRYQVTPIMAGWATLTYVLASLPNLQTSNTGLSLRWAGQSSAQVLNGMDGVTTNGDVSQLIAMVDVEEVTVVTVGNSAQYRSVGFVNSTYKSGTNQFHGNAYYTHQNSALFARDYFYPKTAQILVHRFGVDVSGPVIRNKTFFFSSWNGERIPGHSYYVRDVPTNLMRSGDFSQLATNIKDPLTGQPFSGKQIPQGRINSVAQKVNELYLPAPNQGGANQLIQNYVFLHPYPTDLFSRDYLTNRIDHQFSDKDRLFGRVSNRFTPYVLAGNYPGFAWTRYRHHDNVTAEEIHLFSANLVNALRFGWFHDNVVDGGAIKDTHPIKGGDAVKTLGIQGVNPTGINEMGFPTMSITGYSAVTSQYGGLNGGLNTLVATESLTWARGRHVIKTGGEYKHYGHESSIAPAGTYGNFTFNGTLTGNAYADFLLGLPYSSQRITPLLDRHRTTWEFGTYVQDTFKATSKLTLDYGLRWDYFGADRYSDGLMYNWDASTGNVIVEPDAMQKISSLYPVNTIQVKAGQAVANPSKTNFAPRFGAAYRLFGGNTVVRGGYGLFVEALGQFSRLQSGGPFQIGETFNNAIQNGQPLFSFPNPFPAAGSTIASQSVSGYPLDTQNGRIHQFNISVDRQVGSVGLRLSYIGSRNHGLNYSININKPQPSLTKFTQSRLPYTQFVSASTVRSDGRETYNALSLEAQRKVGGLTFQYGYTYASNLSNTLNLENPYAALSWSRISSVPRQRVTLNTMWQIPLGRNRRWLKRVPGVLEGVIGGWDVYHIAVFQTGQYFSPSFSGSDPSNTNTSGGLPDRVGNGNLPTDQRSVEHWFDRTAFAVPAAGRFGNSGTNVLQGPGLNSHGLTASKGFRLKERLGLRIMVAISDLFNHPNFLFPSANVSVPASAGVISGTYGGGGSQGGGGLEMADHRRVEFRARLEF